MEAVNEDPASLRQQVENAKNDWQAARSYFDNLTDPELIDYAIYSLEAAERKYMYLLKKYKSRCRS
ncbi:MAG TPA: YaaL family protein [Firmicutes bacterium]|nr:YaaL family protein [Bacillota bacterium]